MARGAGQAPGGTPGGRGREDGGAVYPDEIAGWVEQDLTLVRVHELLERSGTAVIPVLVLEGVVSLRGARAGQGT